MCASQIVHKIQVVFFNFFILVNVLVLTQHHFIFSHLYCFIKLSFDVGKSNKKHFELFVNIIQCFGTCILFLIAVYKYIRRRLL